MKVPAFLHWLTPKNLITFLAFAAACWVLPAHAEPSDKYASIVLDAETKQVLHARYADSPRYPASLTKVMTLYMVFDALDKGELKLDEEIPVSYRASRAAPSKLNLRAGSTIKVEDAILALVTKSANDVAIVLAERLGGSESRFAALMTVKSRALGMYNTRFYNASGLPDARQISTARDLAILGNKIMTDHADYYEYFATKTFRYGGAVYKNHNGLLGKVDGVDGIKTGYTRASGFNLLASAKRDKTRIITVVLGGESSRARNDHVAELLEAAFKAIEKTAPASPDLRTRIAFENIQNPQGRTGVTGGILLEQGSATD